MHVFTWVAKLAEDEGYSIFDCPYFLGTFYFLFKDSKNPMSLFLKLSHVKILLQKCNVINVNAFSYLFDLFLKASKQYATQPIARELLNKLPTELPVNRKEFKGWFLTQTISGFRMSTIVNFYIWLAEECRSISLISHDLVDVLQDYLQFLKANYARGKYKQMRVAIMYLVWYLQPGIKERVKLLNNDTKGILKNFVDYKVNGLAILYKDQKISDTRWKASNAITCQNSLENFLKKVIKVRGCSETDISQFSVFSLTLEDYLKANELKKIPRKETQLLRQFIPYLLTTPNIPKKYKTQLVNLYQIMPKPTPSTYIAGSGNFISRRDYLIMINTAFTTCRSNTQLKYVIYLLLIGFTALRVSEAVQVQIGDFKLDDHGLLADVGNGFGMLMLPAYKSKGAYCPCIEPFNIAVVPKYRELINTYLGMNFMKSHSPETYIIRNKPVSEYDVLFDDVPNHQKNEMEYALWVQKIRQTGITIVKEIFLRTKLQLETKIQHGNVSSHDLRRSINNWIKKTPINLPPDSVNRIAEIHLRHKKKGSVNEIHYTSEPTIAEYIECVNNALNFPWDLPSLEIWERQRMLPALNNSYESENQYPTLKTIETKETIYDLIPEFKHQRTISPKQKRVRSLETEIGDIERLLKSGIAENKIKLQATLCKLQTELNIIKEV